MIWFPLSQRQGPPEKLNCPLRQQPGIWGGGREKTKGKDYNAYRRVEVEKGVREKKGVKSGMCVGKVRVWILPLRSRKALSITRKEKKPLPHFLPHALDTVASFETQVSVHHFI